MRQLAAFTKKEFTEVTRTGKFYILLVIFVIFGIMNPAVSKLTPWIFEMLSDSMKQQGISIGNFVVTAMTSWEQYYKNLSMEFIVFVVMFCPILALEYQKGTLINMLTKGLPRWKVIAAKSIALFVMWSFYYWIAFGITFGYTAYFWDNSIVSNLWFAAVCPYIFGIWLISLIMMFSVIFNTSTAVLLSTGAVYTVTYIISLIPTAINYLPIKLTLGMELLTKSTSISNYTIAIFITLGLILINSIFTILTFNKKKV